MAWGKTTYQTSNEMRESLLDILRDVSPNEDNYLTSNLKKMSPAMNTLHEWNLFYDARPTSATGLVEGADTSYSDMTVETRSQNYTVIHGEPVRLSRTRASIASVTGEDALSTEKERALRRLKAKMEYTIVNGSAAAGATDTARGMAGLDKCISTNVTARASATSFSEVELNDIVQQSYDKVGMSYVMDTLIAPIVIKRRVATFGTNLTRNINASDKRLTQEVRVYDSDVGQTVAIIAHKDVRKDAATTTVYGIREELFGLAFLVDSGEPHWEDRAQDGDRTAGTYITEFTLVSQEERASVKRTGYYSTL